MGVAGSVIQELILTEAVRYKALFLIFDPAGSRMVLKDKQGDIWSARLEDCEQLFLYN